MTMASAPAIHLEGVVKTFPNPLDAARPIRAVDGISLKAGGAEASDRLIALVGPDGAGKSTFIRLLCGLEAPDEGRLSVLGTTPDPDNEDFTTRIAFMPQTLGLYKTLSCRENLEVFAGLRGFEGEADGAAGLKRRIAELLSMTGLAGFEERQAGKLSGGMKQKLGLACALLGEPKLLILDEPTVGVDPLSRRELRRILDAMRLRSRMTVVMSTAYLDEAETADRVIVLSRGRIAAQGKPQALCAPLTGRTFRAEALEAEHSSTLARTLMEAAALPPGQALIIDAVPRGRFIDLLAAAQSGANALSLRLRQSLHSGPLPAFHLAQRPPTLEDLLADQGYPSSDAASGSSASKLKNLSAIDAQSENLYAPAALFPGEYAVEAIGLSRRFGSFTAVADSTFQVRRGEIFGLLGPNGAGKTTTFRMLCGLLAPTTGDIRAAGADLRRAKSAARARVGYVAQKFSLYERLTARQNLEYFGEAYGVAGQNLARRIDALAAELGLSDDLERRTAVLPLGAKRELAFACALIHRPAVLFLDEATSGADLTARRTFWRRIVRLSQAGTTIVVTTHFMEEAEYCDRILIQDNGRILASGTPLEVRTRANAESIDEAFRQIVLNARRAEAENKRAKSSEGAR